MKDHRQREVPQMFMLEVLGHSCAQLRIGQSCVAGRLHSSPRMSPEFPPEFDKTDATIEDLEVAAAMSQSSDLKAHGCTLHRHYQSSALHLLRKICYNQAWPSASRLPPHLLLLTRDSQSHEAVVAGDLCAW